MLLKEASLLSRHFYREVWEKPLKGLRKSEHHNMRQNTQNRILLLSVDSRYLNDYCVSSIFDACSEDQSVMFVLSIIPFWFLKFPWVPSFQVFRWNILHQKWPRAPRFLWRIVFFGEKASNEKESSKTALSFWQKTTPLPSGDVMVVWTKKHKATPLLKKSTSKFGNTHEIRGICDRRKKIKTAVKTPMIGSNFGGHPHTIMDTKKEPLLDTKMH